MKKPDKGEGHSLAAWVALRGLEHEWVIILKAAIKEDSHFFIALGRYLSDWNRDFWARLDEKITSNWPKLRGMSRRDGCLWLKGNGFPTLTEVAYRQRLVGPGLTRKK